MELVEGAIEAARQGRSAVLLIHGEPGIGKTALLAWAEEHAPGFLRCRVRGSQIEAQIAFAGLFDLLRPFFPLLHELPSTQAAALGSALGLAPAQPVDRLAVYGAALFLVVTAAERSTLLVTVDDVGWLDESSQEALAFLVRRLEREPIACLIAGRTGELGLFADVGVPSLGLTGLRPDAAAEVIRSSTGSPLGDAVLDELIDAAAGNPLALRELPLLLSTQELAGSEPIRQPLPIASGIEAAFGRRLDGLTAGTAEAVLLVAAGEPEEWPAIASAAEQIGVDRGWVTEAEDRHVLALREHTVWFSHPLMRSAALLRATEEERRRAHRLLGELTQDDERRAWHRAAAAEGPDEAVAAALEAVAAAAVTRGSPAVASAGYERAAELSLDVGAGARRLLAAVETASAGNRIPRALDLADRRWVWPHRGTAGPCPTHPWPDLDVRGPLR